MFSKKDTDEKVLVKNIKDDFFLLKSFRKLSWFRSLLTCQSKYQRFVLKSKSTLLKDMDLRKFILRQRAQTIAILALLSGP